MSIITIQGIYRDRLLDPAGRLIFDSGWRKNLIVLGCRVLLASFFKNEQKALGIQSMQVGRGSPEWDNTAPSPPDPNTTNKLVDENPISIPIGDLKIEYLDSADNVVTTASHRIQITATLGHGVPPVGEPPLPLREFGLFGSLDEVPSMIDYIRHTRIDKDGAFSLERKVRLIF